MKKRQKIRGQEAIIHWCLNILLLCCLCLQSESKITTVFLILCDYNVGRSMTLDSRSPWTNPQKNKWWEETLLYYSQTKFYWWLHKPRISPCISALQTNLRMHFKPWSLQKERRACLLSLFHPGLQIFLWWYVCLAACLPPRSAKSSPLPRNSSKVSLFLSHFFPSSLSIHSFKTFIPSVMRTLWVRVSSSNHLQECAFSSLVHWQTYCICYWRTCYSLCAWNSDLWGWLSAVWKYLDTLVLGFSL